MLNGTEPPARGTGKIDSLIDDQSRHHLLLMLAAHTQLFAMVHPIAFSFDDFPNGPGDGTDCVLAGWSLSRVVRSIDLRSKQSGPRQLPIMIGLVSDKVKPRTVKAPFQGTDRRKTSRFHL